MIGKGPQEAELRRRFPDAVFLGQLEGNELAGHLAAADVFVFPSRTDTFGNVQLEALESLAVMDAERLEFPDDSFDAVVAQYVVNTVPHPEVALGEFARVLKPGGEIILINRIGAGGGLRRALEVGLAPAGHCLGWRPEFRWERFAGWLDRTPGVRLIERRPVPPLGHFSLIRFGKVAAGDARPGAGADARAQAGAG